MHKIKKYKIEPKEIWIKGKGIKGNIRDSSKNLSEEVKDIKVNENKGTGNKDNHISKR